MNRSKPRYVVIRTSSINLLAREGLFTKKRRWKTAQSWRISRDENKGIQRDRQTPIRHPICQIDPQVKSRLRNERKIHHNWSNHRLKEQNQFNGHETLHGRSRRPNGQKAGTAWDDSQCYFKEANFQWVDWRSECDGHKRFEWFFETVFEYIAFKSQFWRNLSWSC